MSRYDIDLKKVRNLTIITTNILKIKKTYIVSPNSLYCNDLKY